MSGDRLPLLVFDVNETLSDMTPLGRRFEDVGVAADLMPLWFAGVLRDGFALTAAGAYADFADVARDGLRRLLASAAPAAEHTGPDDPAGHVLAGFSELNVHPDVADGVRALRAAGYRLVTMTNGNAALTDGLLTRAGVRDCFEALWDVTGPRHWKPDPRSYAYVTRQAGVRPAEAMLVAVHPWDIDGARRAGLAGAWLRRGVGADAYPRTMTAPTLTAEDLGELAQLLG
ncbi:haloacid dehalogenase type II [Streptomyces tirandamycinicus]|uniref:Haloacid dehalogenase type II n=1 Tax=Streptomyces tirandamycinicus TaxID=2174846 RepID=A0A2S1T077_9ACTN|nr:haloacid dehalogenase type II [Streptomyces tirandamycinicus]AWI32026.1 haloacid dehalogenase type II [Streptomyces tirandamycinicus]